MAHSFIAYVDESGDDGLQKFRQPGAAGGASRWLIISACIIRASRDLEAVRWRDEIRAKCGSAKKGRDIHFKDFNHSQRRAACQLLHRKALRFTSIIARKDVEEASAFQEKNQLYFYLTRYLVERISWFCRDMRPNVPEGDGTVKIVFSRRGGMSYGDFRVYLERLRANPPTSIHWPVIDIAAVDAQDHSRVAALQIADIGASAVGLAIEPDKFGNVEGVYIRELKEMMYQRRGQVMSYGVKFLPNIDRAGLTEDQLNNFSIFR